MERSLVLIRFSTNGTIQQGIVVSLPPLTERVSGKDWRKEFVLCRFLLIEYPIYFIGDCSLAPNKRRHNVSKPLFDAESDYDSDIKLLRFHLGCLISPELNLSKF